jgi:hypothetical protein
MSTPTSANCSGLANSGVPAKAPGVEIAASTGASGEGLASPRSNPVSKSLAKHAYRTEFDRSRKLVAAARAGALGLHAHGPNRPSAAICVESNTTLHRVVRKRPAQPLANCCSGSVRVTIEIEAEIPAGAPDNVVRTVTENSRTLKFTSNSGFETE